MHGWRRMGVTGEDGMGTKCYPQGTRQQDNIGTGFLPSCQWLPLRILDLSGRPSGSLLTEPVSAKLYSVSAKLYSMWQTILSYMTSIVKSVLLSVETRVDVIRYIWVPSPLMALLVASVSQSTKKVNTLDG